MRIVYPQSVELSRFLRIHKCSRERWSNRDHSRMGGHWPKAHGLDLVVSGHGELWIRDDGPRQPFNAGDLILTRKGSWYCYDPLPGHHLEHLWIRADGDWLESVFGSFGMSEITATAIPARPGHDAQFSRIYELCQAQSPPAISEAVGLTAALFGEVLADVRVLGGRSAPAVDVCERFCHYARERAAEARLDVDHFLRLEGIGYETFRKRFRAAVGDSPVRYWEAARINQAKVLLVHEDRQVGEVAERLGFADLYTFSAFFKRKTGMSPTTFRKREQ